LSSLMKWGKCIEDCALTYQIMVFTIGKQILLKWHHFVLWSKQNGMHSKTNIPQIKCKHSLATHFTLIIHDFLAEEG
jgi:hypothetical protein